MSSQKSTNVLGAKDVVVLVLLVEDVGVVNTRLAATIRAEDVVPHGTRGGEVKSSVLHRSAKTHRDLGIVGEGGNVPCPQREDTCQR